MKKWMVYVLIGILTTGSAFAQSNGGSGRGKTQKGYPNRAEHQQLVEAIQCEANPKKKAAMVRKLRRKVTAGTDRRQAEFRSRLGTAEKGVEEMKKRLLDAERNKTQRVDRHMQNLLSGE